MKWFSTKISIWMPYDEAVAARIRAVISSEPGYSEKKMFGGVCFMLDGHMCCGVVNDELMLRLGDELASAALDEPNTRPMDFTGRPMKSMIYVEPAGFADKAALRAWVGRAARFVRTLPPK